MIATNDGMTNIRRIFVSCALLGATCLDGGAKNLLDGLHYGIEQQLSFSDGKTPLWLNANKYGLSSLSGSNGYWRAAAIRPLAADSARRWAVGYGVDAAVAFNYTSTLVVQQAFAEARWLKGTLTVGSKQQPMELKNNSLSSGAQTLGINARPVPQVRIALPGYWDVPLTGGWIGLKGHIAFGKFTDDSWQHDFTARRNKYADDVLYHSKAGYLRICKPGARFSVELGLEMAAQFGGTLTRPAADGTFEVYKSDVGFSDFWHAFIPGGGDMNETTYQNMEGNQVGSWLARITYDAPAWRLAAYADHYFEDHSAMFLLDYNGYGTGDEWNVKKDSRYFMYDLKDMMLGAELNLKNGTWLRDIVFEYIYTKYQSGPVYHDRTPSMSDHISGIDDYYNHGLYPGWQHWGQVMGNPLYLSPIYNTDGQVYVGNNRFYAFHLGVGGAPADGLSYRMLATVQKGFGTYRQPYTQPRHNFSMLLEAQYAFGWRWLKGFSVRGGFGLDSGGILGDNCGFQLTVCRSGLLNLKKKRQ